MRLSFQHSVVLLLALVPSIFAQQEEPPPSEAHDEVYWRLRDAQIDARYDDEISRLKAELARLMSRRFDLKPEDVKGVEVKPVPSGGGLPPEALSLRQRISDLEKERVEAHEKLEEEGLREGALPGWFRPPTPNSEIWEKVGRAQEKETEQAERASKAQKEKEARAPHDEKYWRKRFAELRSRLSTLQAEQARLQQELNQLWMRRMDASPYSVYGSHLYYLPMITESQNRLRANQEKLQKAGQELEDAEEELRKSGGLPGWARE